MMMIDEDGDEVLAVYDYFPYGKKIVEMAGGEKPETHTFTGKELDRYDKDVPVNEDGEGYYYFGARFLDADIGGWISPDLSNQFWSPFSYTGNGINPIIGVDPDGRDVEIFTRSVLKTRWQHMVVRIYNRAGGKPDVTYSVIQHGAEKPVSWEKNWPVDVKALKNPADRYVMSIGDPEFDEFIVGEAEKYKPNFKYPWDVGFLTDRLISNTAVVNFFADLGIWFFPEIFLPDAPTPGLSEGKVLVDWSGVECVGCTD